MRLENHKITDIPFRAARHMGGVITPTLVVLHDTAGRLTKGNSADYLRDNDVQVSVQFVVERDGSAEQQVPTNRRANHAGKSSYHGRSNCNDFSIGIEIVNPGKMSLLPGTPVRGLAWWGETLVDGVAGDLVAMTTPEHGSGVWLAYTKAQIETVTVLLRALFAGIPTLQDIRTHWYVSPGRKVDTNPLFPLEQIRNRVLGRGDPADLEADAASIPMPTTTMAKVVTAGSRLNMRRWPSFNPNVIAGIPNGTVVPVLRSGSFDGRRWLCVQFDGLEGWIVEAYTHLV
ncbi:N-acetylmuramoyl-L-alanine amidase [Paracoccus denitrificans]|uniref:N-acetylmuramoyl-L-alanine amidase n=1 Tax=Paracoccus denitrificans TaxID=266 RepID=UPI001E4CBB37|nr:N-acetylmuramoyl-L-alanine amidase [Paracoccus denitrificans]UFS63824.1 N-acetylmuramoyl-L-alanine amidase [Paracoccus denitrificans]